VYGARQSVVRSVNVVLISTYELGRQPFGLASPAAWLRQVGATVTCLDLAVQPFEEGAVASADLVALYVPMHTATRLAAQLVPRIRALNPRAHLCFYGLYASVNAAFLAELGAQTILGGEFEAGLAALAQQLGADTQPQAPGQSVSLARQRFLVPTGAACPSSSTTPTCSWRTMNGASWAPPKPRAAASICVGTARSRRCTGATSAWCSPTSSWPTSPSRCRPVRSTSPSAIPIFSTDRVTP